jgi:hypothetical protein
MVGRRLVAFLWQLTVCSDPRKTSRVDTHLFRSRLIEKHQARLVIQLAPEDFAALPKFPAHLDLRY